MGGSNRVLTSDVTVRNSRFERKGRMGVAFTGAEDILVENNHISQSRRAMFDIEPKAFDLAKAVIEPRLQDAEGRFGLAYGLANARKVWTDDYSAEVLGPQAP